MINKFPKLADKDRDAIYNWLIKQNHLYLAEHHKYAACSNKSEALKMKHYADVYANIQMMMEWHTENSSSKEKANAS